MAEFNPYSAPLAAIGGVPIVSPGVWRDGQEIVVAEGGVFPDRCLKCNAPAEGFRLKPAFRWLPGVRPEAKIPFPLCPQHRSDRTRTILAAWIVSVIAMGLMITLTIIAGRTRTPSSDALDTIGIGGGLLLLVYGFYLGTERARAAPITKVEAGFARLAGVHPDFVKALPPYDKETVG